MVQGVQTNKKYIEAILKMAVLQSKAELLRVLGMVKYVGKFIPNLSKIIVPLRELIRNDINFIWNKHKKLFCYLTAFVD